MRLWSLGVVSSASEPSLIVIAGGASNKLVEAEAEVPADAAATAVRTEGTASLGSRRAATIAAHVCLLAFFFFPFVSNSSRFSTSRSRATSSSPIENVGP